MEMSEDKNKVDEPIVPDAESEFEAGNLNKYDCLKLKEKNLKIETFETEYVDPADDEVKDIKDHPCIDQEELEKRKP